MYGFLKWPVCLLLCLVWLNSAHAAEEPAAPPSPSAPPTQATPADSQKVPVINVPEPSFDSGEIPEGKALNHAFKIKNTGTEVLKIERVRPG